MKNVPFSSNQADIKPISPTLKLNILTKFQCKREKSYILLFTSYHFSFFMNHTLLDFIYSQRTKSFKIKEDKNGTQPNFTTGNDAIFAHSAKTCYARDKA